MVSDSRMLQLDWSPDLDAFWIARVQSALLGCRSPSLRERYSRWDRDPHDGLTLGDLAVAVATKQTMVSLIVQRVNARLAEIGKVLKSDRPRVEECLRVGGAYRLPDKSVAHDAAVDFDSFVFESRSAYEITVSFLQRFFAVILKQPLGKGKAAHDRVQEALRNRGAQTGWADELREKRHLLIHERAIWLGFEVTGEYPFRFDPVLLTKTVGRIEDDPDRLSIGLCRDLWEGFIGSYGHIEAWLKEGIAIADARG